MTPFKFDRPFRLSIEPILARTTIKREVDIKTPIAVSCLHGYATTLLAVANQLISVPSRNDVSAVSSWMASIDGPFCQPAFSPTSQR